MARRPPLPFPLPDALRPRRALRDPERLTTAQSVRNTLVPLAGVIGADVLSQTGDRVGKLVDVIARWDGVEPYPPVVGLVVRVGFRPAFVPASQIATMRHEGVQLSSARVDLRDFERRPGEVPLAHDVLDHQLVDVDGVQVVRANDLYLAPVGGRILLVAADVGFSALARRLGPRRIRRRPTIDRLIDWAEIQPFGEQVPEVRLRTNRHEGLARLRPGELADILEDLDRAGRRELLASLEPEVAADALEEMEAEELEVLLREMPPEEAAELIAAMEPDEAADALRDLDDDERTELLGLMPEVIRLALERLLVYREDTAGGLMTTRLVVVSGDTMVAAVRRQLMAEAEHKIDIDSVLIVDGDGCLVDDITTFELLVAEPDTPVSALVGPPLPVTVRPDSSLEEVIDKLVENRGSSVVVLDDDGKPVGRVFADDVVDALVPERGARRFPRLLSS